MEAANNIQETPKKSSMEGAKLFREAVKNIQGSCEKHTEKLKIRLLKTSTEAAKNLQGSCKNLQGSCQNIHGSLKKHFYVNLGKLPKTSREAGKTFVCKRGQI